MPAVEEIYKAIEEFLAVAKQPAVVEPGGLPIPLNRDSYDVGVVNGRLTLHAWSPERNVVRRIVGMGTVASGKVELVIERFGRRTGALELVDLAKPRHQSVNRRAVRQAYREQFRRSLLRQFSGWMVSDLSSEADLQRTFSPAYSRAMVSQGSTAWAVLGIPPEHLHADAALSFGLIWLDHLRNRERRIAVQGLALFIPEGQQRNVCLRLLHLAGADAQWMVFIYGDGFEERVDLSDYGNLSTSLPSTRSGSLPPGWTRAISEAPGVDTVLLPEGGISWRINGLQFSSYNGSQVTFGIETATPATASNLPEILMLSAQLARRRTPAAVDRQSPLFLRNPESWFESRVRARITDIDASLVPAPFYGQVPAIAAGERGVIDLLACDHAARLAVVEVKSSEDLHLPLQALDYWIRVKWHLDRDEFTSRGFFPGIALRRESPRMLLVAPALAFHPATESILRYFPATIEVVRIGVAMDWRSDLRVVFRANGPSTPAAQMWAQE